MSRPIDQQGRDQRSALERAAHARAFVKAVTWRVLGTLDTFLWAWLITHTPTHAGQIASLETMTKIVLYYLHERLWRMVKIGADAHLRSLIKAVTWRFIGSADTFILSLLVTGNARYAVSIASLEALSKIVLYYLHERAWRGVRWGRLDNADARDRSAPATPAAALASPAYD